MTHLSELERVFNKFSMRPVLVYGDPDVDGLMAMLLACQFLDMRGIKYSYYVNSKRQHGFMLQPSTLAGYFVIAVDFDIPEQIMQALVDADVAVLSMDHHTVSGDFIHCVSGKYEAEGIVINNQYPFEPDEDRYQSGAGVVYEALSACWPEYRSKEREAIVGITLLSDVRPIENSKAREYLKTTYTIDPQKGYIGYLINSVLDADYGFGVPKMDRNFIDFTFAPRVNSLLRFGRDGDAVGLILGTGFSGTKPKDLQDSLLQAMKDRCTELELANIKVLSVDTLDFLDFPDIDLSSFIGLLCNNVKNKGKSVIGFVVDNGKIVRASFRGRYDDVMYLTAVRNTGVNANGHPSAFGILDLEPSETVWQELDDVVGDVESYHEQTRKIVEVSNLGMYMVQNGMKAATENCYVRDMFRTYVDYKGSNVKEVKRTYKDTPLTKADILEGKKPDLTKGGRAYRYVIDQDGNKVPKYIEYVVDGRVVKSFGVELGDGYILPVLEKGYVSLYVREKIS